MKLCLLPVPIHSGEATMSSHLFCCDQFVKNPYWFSYPMAQRYARWQLRWRQIYRRWKYQWIVHN